MGLIIYGDKEEVIGFAGDIEFTKSQTELKNKIIILPL